MHSNGGFLLHTGHPNPGFNRVIKKYSSLWASSDLPIIVHLMAEDKESLSEMINRLESCENVLAIELGFSPQMDINAVGQLVQAAQGELPLILNLSLDQSLMFADEVPDLPVSMLRLSGPDGLLPDEEGNLQSGRLFGPALLPLALAEVKRLHAFSKSAQQRLRIIGGGGIYSKDDVSAMLLAGAEAIAFDTLLWHPATDLSVILGD